MMLVTLPTYAFAEGAPSHDVSRPALTNIYIDPALKLAMGQAKPGEVIRTISVLRDVTGLDRDTTAKDRVPLLQR